MNQRARDALVRDYLRRLARALRDVPEEARRELLADIRAHIEEARAAAPEEDEAALRTILERLGPPDVLARELRARLDLPEPGRGPGLLEGAAVVLMALFWPAGVVLAWLSPRWLARDKVVATLLPVLSLALALVLTIGVATVSGVGGVHSGPAVEVSSATPGGPPVPVHEPRASGPLPGPLEQVLVVGLVLYLTWGAPITAAAYLALRLRPGAGRWAVAVPPLAGLLVVAGLTALTVAQ